MKTLILGIGAQRAGTTWLFDYLSGHPEIYCSKVKEFHFWDSYFDPAVNMNWRAKLASRAHRSDVAERLAISTPEQYFDFFRQRMGDKPFACDITPSYALLSKENFQTIRDEADQAGFALKVVFIMRDPVDRHRSFLAHGARDGVPPRDFTRTLKSPAALRSRYDITLENAFAVFPDVVTGFFEHVTKDPATLMKVLGLSLIPTREHQRKNASPPIPPLSQDEIKTGLETFAPVYQYVNERFGDQKPSSWRA